MEVQVNRLDGTEPEEVYTQLAEIHRSEIQEGFLSTLGTGFLVTLYKVLSRSEHSFVLTALEGTRILGFIVGSLNTGAVYKEFARKAGLRAIFVLAPRLVSLSRIRRVVETVVYPSRKKGDGLPEAEILNFCVRSETQSKGVGGRLFQRLCAEFRDRGVREIRIVTGESQRSAQSFYEKHGARLAAQTEVHKGTASRVYVYDTGSEA